MDINLELTSYAYGFTRFLIREMRGSDLKSIRSIILFGSVAQGRAGKESDIDLFIDVDMTPSKSRRFRSKIESIERQFTISNEGLLYSSRGIYNRLSIIVGNLPEWEGIKRSISSSGIVLYGRFSTPFTKDGLQHNIIFFWEGEGKNRGAFLNKIYGYRTNGKKYQGLIEILKGKKIGKSAALIPAQRSGDFMEVLEKYKISYKIIEVFV